MTKSKSVRFLQTLLIIVSTIMAVAGINIMSGVRHNDNFAGAINSTYAKAEIIKYTSAWTKDENGNSSITNAISAFVDIYNNTLDSSVKLDDHDVERYIKQMKKITRENKSKLRDMGIEIKNGGKLEIKRGNH